MSKEIIEKLESIEWFCVGYKTYSCFVCKQLEENGHTKDCALGQAITALKAEPKAETLQAEAEAGRRLWSDAQKRCKVQAVRGDKLQAEIKQLIQALELAKIMIDRRQAKLAATRLNRNEFFDETVKLQAELDKLRGITHGDSAIAIIEGLEVKLAKAKERIEGLKERLSKYEGQNP